MYFNTSWKGKKGRRKEGRKRKEDRKEHKVGREEKEGEKNQEGVKTKGRRREGEGRTKACWPCLVTLSLELESWSSRDWSLPFPWSLVTNVFQTLQNHVILCPKHLTVLRLSPPDDVQCPQLCRLEMREEAGAAAV